MQHVGSEVTEEDARNFVKENPSFLEQSPYVHAFHILVETEEEAQEIIQLLGKGADFMELGKERSLDSFVELGPIRRLLLWNRARSVLLCRQVLVFILSRLQKKKRPGRSPLRKFAKKPWRCKNRYFLKNI